ncbi:MAG: hypothetical protein NTX42_01940 [Methanothrix sp.]|nr:hypothetical protein [Methanothrix sp.]
MEPFLDKGHPGRQPSSARRARLSGKLSGAREAGRAWEPGEDGAKQTRLETMAVRYYY